LFVGPTPRRRSSARLVLDGLTVFGGVAVKVSPPGDVTG
jgi:hypothetical protein